ncbi:MAG: rhomboid family intramembrane serine protease [Propylenella sp.]
MSDAVPDRWIEIGRYLLPSEAEGEALALAAIGIGSRLIPQEGGVGLFVSDADAARASRELLEYRRENRPRAEPALRPASEGVDAALAYAAVLVVVHVVAGRRMFGVDWVSAGAAEAGLILGGEWWRALTALTLHIDFGHLASNAVAGGVLGILLAQVLGPGLAWLAILLAGGIGNALNALVQPTQHTAIGASTAVFAALGLLAALMWRRRASQWTRRLRRWLPLAAGVMLLAFLGTGGERTDVGAHIAGFAVGVVGGAGLAFAGARVPQGRVAQYSYGATALALCGFAWLLAVGAV